VPYARLKMSLAGGTKASTWCTLFSFLIHFAQVAQHLNLLTLTFRSTNYEMLVLPCMCTAGGFVRTSAITAHVRAYNIFCKGSTALL
jgi:hypothetical protein